jgi:hypothetical protein
LKPMPNLYFCQPHAKNQGMLRAVLSLKECERLVSRHPATYVGEHFPNLPNSQAGANDFAVLSFGSGETSAAWRPGFYRLDSDLGELNDVLRELAR